MMKMYHGKNCLVTGGNGFIATHLIKRLTENGALVTSIDIKQSKSPLSNVDYLVSNLSNSGFCSSLKNSKYHYVFNCSGIIDHSEFMVNGLNVIRSHYIGLLNLLEAIDLDTLEGFVQIGSSDEYGNQPSPQFEHLATKPISCYSHAKASATQLIEHLAKNEGLPATTLRFFLVYGPGQNNQRFLPQIIQGCLEDKSIPVSRGEQLRDFCFIDDVVDALLLAAITPQSFGEVINIASGIPVSIADVTRTVREIIGSGEPMFGEVPYRQGENMSLYADIDKAKKILRWEPKTSLRLGLEQTIKFYQKKLQNKGVLQ